MQFDPERSTAAGYWRVAAQYAVAGQLALQHSDRLLFPVMQLHGQAIELSLKAFLLKRGTSLQQVEAMRHRLTDLLQAARVRRLGTEVRLGRKDVAMIQLLDQNYSKHRFRYIVTGATRVPEVAQLSQLANRLVVGLENYCTGMEWGITRLVKPKR